MKQTTAPRNYLTIHVTRELFTKGVTKYENERAAELALAQALRKIPNVAGITRNKTDERYICDVTIGTDALSLVAEATHIMAQVYKAAQDWAGLQQSPTVA